MGEEASLKFMNATGKVQMGIECSFSLPVQEPRGHDMFSLVGNRPVKLLTEQYCAPQKPQEKTGKAFGRDSCCGWEKSYIRCSTDPC